MPKGTGGVGIGAAPQYRLDVSGTKGTIGIRSGSNTANDVLYYATGTVTGSLYMFLSAINATGAVQASVVNSNTATGRAEINVQVAGASSGDPLTMYTIAGAQNWAVGIDNSDSDKFKIASGSLLGGGVDRLTIDTSGALSVSGSLSLGAPVTKTGDFTWAVTENWIIVDRAAGSTTATLPAAASFSGRILHIKTIQAQTVVSASSNVVPLAGGAAGAAILAGTAGKWATLVSDGTNWIILEGN